MQRQIYRTKRSSVVAGVCAAVARYFGLDPTIVRIVWLIAAFTGGFGVAAYIVAVLIIPERNDLDYDFPGYDNYESKSDYGSEFKRNKSGKDSDFGNDSNNSFESRDRNFRNYDSAYGSSNDNTSNSTFDQAHDHTHDHTQDHTQDQTHNSSYDKTFDKNEWREPSSSTREYKKRRGYILGATLAVLGLAMLIKPFIHIPGNSIIWPVVLIAAGLIFILKGKN